MVRNVCFLHVRLSRILTRDSCSSAWFLLVVYSFSLSNEHYLCFRPEQKEAKLVALAKEAGFGDDEPPAESTQTVEAKKDVKIMKSQLKVLLQQPVIDPLNSSRFAI